MTCGVYLLKFTGTDLVYIGQSINIEDRYSTHLYNLSTGVKANKKLHAAYTLYGAPKLEILEECTIDKLSELESYYIKDFDTIDNGLNILSNTDIKGYSLPGVTNPNSKYSMEVCEAVFNEIVAGTISLLEISKTLNVHKSLVYGIAEGLAHRSWLEEKYPEKYAILLSKQGKWKHKGVTNELFIKDPLGNVHKISTSLKEFALQYDLNSGHISSVLSGKRVQHKGWTLP